MRRVEGTKANFPLRIRREKPIHRTPMDDFSELLTHAAQGDQNSAEALLPLVYQDLRKLAQIRMSDESSAHTLQPTALVHEAWISMAGSANQSWENRACFLSAASTAMRHILVDHARKKAALKRGGDMKKVALSDIDQPVAEPDEAMLMVDDALRRLEQLRPEWARIVVMKYYGGMTNPEVAETLGISVSSVDRYWAGARALLYKYIKGEA